MAQYEPTDIKIGTRPITVTSYHVFGQTLYVYGSGFNTYSTVRINGDKHPTTYIDEGTLAIENVKGIETLDVVQIADDGTILAVSNTK